MGDDSVSASTETINAVNSVHDGIGELEGHIQELIDLGIQLVGEDSWVGPDAEAFREEWTGGVKASLEDSVETLEEINDDARLSAENIGFSGGADLG